jgi:hypothetical protein
VASLDRVSDEYRHKGIFISLKQPNPAFFYPQQVVEQRIATTVPSSQPVRVYARTLRHDARQTADDPYTTAATAPGH